MGVVEKVKSYIGAYNATDIRSLLHSDHEQISALTEQISGDESKRHQLRHESLRQLRFRRRLPHRSSSFS